MSRDRLRRANGVLELRLPDRREGVPYPGVPAWDKPPPDAKRRCCRVGVLTFASSVFRSSPEQAQHKLSKGLSKEESDDPKQTVD